MHENYGTVDIKHKNKRISIELPLNDELSQFGEFIISIDLFSFCKYVILYFRS